MPDEAAADLGHALRQTGGPEPGFSPEMCVQITEVSGLNSLIGQARVWPEVLQLYLAPGWYQHREATDMLLSSKELHECQRLSMVPR